MTLTEHEKSVLQVLASCPRGVIVPELTWGEIEGVVGFFWNEALKGLYAKKLIQAENIIYDGRYSSRIIVTALGQQVSTR